jgi:hypothetical protein
MPRYYIDIRSRFGIDEDLVGIDATDIEAAYGEALKVGGRLLESWDGALPEARCDITIEIADDTGRMLLMIPFTDVERQIPQRSALPS